MIWSHYGKWVEPRTFQLRTQSRPVYAIKYNNYLNWKTDKHFSFLYLFLFTSLFSLPDIFCRFYFLVFYFIFFHPAIFFLPFPLIRKHLFFQLSVFFIFSNPLPYPFIDHSAHIHLHIECSTF